MRGRRSSPRAVRLGWGSPAPAPRARVPTQSPLKSRKLSPPGARAVLETQGNRGGRFDGPPGLCGSGIAATSADQGPGLEDGRGSRAEDGGSWARPQGLPLRPGVSLSPGAFLACHPRSALPGEEVCSLPNPENQRPSDLPVPRIVNLSSSGGTAAPIKGSSEGSRRGGAGDRDAGSGPGPAGLGVCSRLQERPRGDGGFLSPPPASPGPGPWLVAEKWELLVSPSKTVFLLKYDTC